MKSEFLRQLIDHGESLDIEFKSESRGRLSDADLAEAVVCLANRTSDVSGWLLVGVEDDGTVTGARPRTRMGTLDPLQVQGLIAGRTRPHQVVRSTVCSLGTREVLVIEVPTSRQPVGTADGKYVRRTIGGDGKPACVPFYSHEMTSRQGELGMLDFSTFPLPDLSWKALDPLEFARFRNTVTENAGRSDLALLEMGDEELARALGAVETDSGQVVIRVLGLLLFGRAEVLAASIPTHEVAFQRLAGGKVRVNDLFRWPLLRVMDEVDTRFGAMIQEEEVLVGMTRIGVPDYPRAAFREGVANALVHRDYTRMGAIHVQWHDDRLQISSPGGFPSGVHADNLLKTEPRPRSLLLADAFKRAGLVERTARGIDTIFRAQLRNGRPAPSYGRSNEGGVTLVFPGGRPSLEFVRLVVEEGREGGTLTLDDLLLLSHLRLERRAGVDELATVLQVSRDETNPHLQRLADRGLVEIRGQGRAMSCRLSPATARRLRLEPERVDRRTAEQMEQLVLRYVEGNGRIVRAQAAELCGISPRQATRVLHRLVEKGLLASHGQKRGTWYGPPGGV